MSHEPQEVTTDPFWVALERALPPVFSRQEAAKLLGGLITAPGLANLDSKGEGPTIRVRIGKYTGYEKISFIGWLRGRSSAISPLPSHHNPTEEQK